MYMCMCTYIYIYVYVEIYVYIVYIYLRGVHQKLYSLFMFFVCIILRTGAVLSHSTAQRFRGSEALYPDPKPYLTHLLIVLRRLEARASWGVLGAFWRPLWTSLARLGSLLAHLGKFWQPLAASLARLGSFLAHLGASWLRS